MTSRISRRGTLAGLSLAVLAWACGNYSNDDVEFLNALPHQTDLSVKLGQTSSTGQPLHGDLGQTRQGLVGDPSSFYDGTVGAAQNFNRGVFWLLAVIDYVRLFPPTSRTPLSRTWGPMPSQDNPGFDVRVVISRVAPNQYGYEIDFHHQTGPDTWLPVVTGGFNATGGARKGEGALQLHGKEARDFGVTTLGKGPDLLSVTYSTAGDPIRVNMDIDGGAVSARTEYEEFAPDGGTGDGGLGAGALRFTWSTATDAGTFTFDARSGWLASGQGKGEGQVLFGSFVGGTFVECWDDLYRVTYSAQSWDAGATLGDAGSCPAVPRVP